MKIRRRKGNLYPVRRDRPGEKCSYLVALPKGLVQALGLDGAWIEWQLAGRDRLVAVIHRPQEGDLVAVEGSEGAQILEERGE